MIRVNFSSDVLTNALWKVRPGSRGLSFFIRGILVGLASRIATNHLIFDEEDDDDDGDDHHHLDDDNGCAGVGSL